MPVSSWPQTPALFPDVEQALITVLSPLVDGRVDTRTPPNLETLPDFVRVSRFGGRDDGVTDTSRVDVDTFARRGADAYLIAEKARQLLTAGPHSAGGGVLLDRVVTDVAPHEVSWSEDVRRFTASYTVTARR